MLEMIIDLARGERSLRSFIMLEVKGYLVIKILFSLICKSPYWAYGIGVSNNCKAL